LEEACLLVALWFGGSQHDKQNKQTTSKEQLCNLGGNKTLIPAKRSPSIIQAAGTTSVCAGSSKALCMG